MNAAPAVSGGWRRRFPHRSAAEAFAVVADIESYPQFVPGCLHTRVLERAPGLWRVENVFGFGPARQRFESRAELDAPHELVIASRDGPWREFWMRWRFQDEGDACVASCELRLEFRSPLFASLASIAAQTLEDEVIGAFERRIRRVLKRRGDER